MNVLQIWERVKASYQDTRVVGLPLDGSRIHSRDMRR